MRHPSRETGLSVSADGLSVVTHSDSVNGYLERCLSLVKPVEAESVSPWQAAGLAAAEALCAPVSLPRHTSADVDGFAARAAEISAARLHQPTRLARGEHVELGEKNAEMPWQTAVPVFTGGRLPSDADVVIPNSQVDVTDDAVIVREPVARGSHVRVAGEDIAAGSPIVSAGTTISPSAVGALIAAGVGTVKAHRLPRVAVVTAGHELVRPGDDVLPGFVPDANGPMLMAALAARGVPSRRVFVPKDDQADIAQAIRNAASWADLVITSGGMGRVGDHSVRQALTSLSAAGASWFGRVSMRPGAVQGCTTLHDSGVPVLALPGNPVGALVGFEMFAVAVIRKLAGWRDVYPTVVYAVAQRGWQSQRGTTDYVRVTLASDSGTLTAESVSGLGGHLIAAAARANAIAITPAGLDRVDAGMRVACIPMSGARPQSDTASASTW